MTSLRTAVSIVGVWALAALAPAPAQAQTYVGVGLCAGSECHTKSGEVEWLNSKPGGKEHRGALARLRTSEDKSQRYAKAVSLENFLDPKGMCLNCHGAIPPATKIAEGVTCEGCHGAGSGYRDYHQKTPKDYAGAVSRGLRDLKGKPGAWVRVCRDCHVLNKPEHAPLLDAGHPEGNRWRPSAKYNDIQAHWKRVNYTVAQITAAEAGKAVAVKVEEDPKPTENATPADTKPPPETAKAVTGAAGSGAAVGAPAVSRGGGGRGAAPAAGASSATVSTVDPEPRVSPADPGVTRGVASPLALPPPRPVTSSELFAALQSRFAAYLAGLLTSGASPAQPLKPLPANASVTTGPDAQFLQLQSEVLALAIEALNAKVKPTPDPSAK